MSGAPKCCNAHEKESAVRKLPERKLANIGNALLNVCDGIKSVATATPNAAPIANDAHHRIY